MVATVGRRLGLLIATLSVVAILILSSPPASAKSVRVSMNARWNTTSFLGEACEAVSEFGGDFWKCEKELTSLLSKTKENGAGGFTSSDETDYNISVSILRMLTPSASLRLAELGLSSRMYSPRVSASASTLDATIAASCRKDVVVVGAEGAAECGTSSIAQLVESGLEGEVQDTTPEDHIYGPASSKVRFTVFGCVGEVSTHNAIEQLIALSTTHNFRFAFRHHPRTIGSGPLPVQGYGVYMDIKNMEYQTLNSHQKGDTADTDGYQAILDRISADGNDGVVAGINVTLIASRLAHLLPTKEQADTASLSLLKALVANERNDVDVSEEDVFVKFWQMYALGFQIIHRMHESDAPLDTLADLVNNFPLRVGSLIGGGVDALDKIGASLPLLQTRIQAGYSALILNGITVPDHQQDMFTILQQMQFQELFLISLEKALLPLNQDVVFATTPLQRVLHSLRTCVIPSLSAPSPAASSAGGAGSPSTDTEKRFFLEPTRVMWLNDVEVDARYKAFPKSVKEVLRQGYQPHFPRRNLFNLVILSDPSSSEGFDAWRSLINYKSQGYPTRFGMMVVDSSNLRAIPEGEMPPRNLASITMALTRKLKADGLLDAYLMKFGRNQITEKSVISVAKGLGVSDSIDELLSDPGFVHYYAETQTYLAQLGLRRVPVALFNGYPLYNMDRVLFSGFEIEFPKVKEWVKSGAITDDTTDIYTEILTITNAVKRYQSLVYDNKAYLSLADPRFTELMLNNVTYLYSTEYQLEAVQLTHLILLPPVLEAQHIKALSVLVEHIATCGASCVQTRAGVVFSQKADEVAATPNLAALAVASMLNGKLANKREEVRVTLFRAFVTDLVSASNNEDEATILSILAKHGVKISSTDLYASAFTSPSFAPWVRTVIPASSATFQHTGAILLSNGRLIPLDDSFVVEDHASLDTDIMQKDTNAVRICAEEGDLQDVYSGVLSADDVGSEFIATKLAVISSVLFHERNDMPGDSAAIPDIPKEFLFNNGVNPMAARHHITAIIDPTKREAQRISSIIAKLSEALPIAVTVIVNPPSSLHELPIQSFYRFVFDSHGPQFNPVDGSIVPSAAHFVGLPTSVVFTMGLDEPEAWMVFANSAVDDLDNIRLATSPIHTTLNAVYVLENILVTGKAVDVALRISPKSLPIVLQKPATKNDVVIGAPISDTTVMSMYGYFQLRAAPGLWDVQIQPGPIAAAYVVMDVSTSETSIYSAPKSSLRPAAVRTTNVMVSSFTGNFVNLQVTSELSREQQIERRAANTAVETDVEDATLNIFSVASGHLYERFMRMMMYTVVSESNKTNVGSVGGKKKVKFWLIENFLSPSFKRYLVDYSKQHGFEYQYISYKWPYWLRRQTQKQRTIWGYKILFLDVLFPLGLKKVIFVDADQVVLSDLHELYNLPLQGHPMAYTPFCQVNANTETKGFRFWDSGFWVDHLRGSPYHISAIYVVDLKRLRAMHGGDTYRSVYDNLSRDPNSLSNLDQDLPNFVQHQVPILSLPEEWLWCETWCNADSKSRAKTIDLCNNPMTKVPKLENAKRIIPGWEDLDAKLGAINSAV